MSQELEDIELRSESFNDILKKVPPSLISWGNIILFFLIVSVLILSYVIKYPDKLEAEALLTTKIPPQPVHSRISAQFDTIFVKDKQAVEPEDVLAILENTSNSEDVFYLKTLVDSIKINQTQIDFPFDELPLLFLGEIEPDFVRFENSYFQYLTFKEFDPLGNREFANKISLSEQKQRLSNLRLQKKIAENKLQIEKSDLERNQDLFKKGVISKQEIENKQLEYYTELRNFQNLEALESQIRENIAKSTEAIGGNKFNKSNEELRLLKEVIQSFNSLKKSIKDWELKYVLKSKIKGSVSFLSYWSKNQNVESGDLVFKVLPKNENDIVVKLKVDPQNAGKIKVNQDVNVSLWDYPEYEFGVIKGVVKSVSETTDENGIYIVNVSIPSGLISTYNKQLAFRQEMKGTADIILEDLRLIERLLYQFRDVFDD